MNEPKPFASLGPTLLARKGGAKPAMRPQLAPMGMGGSGGAQAAALKQDFDALEDLGWNDMGDDDTPADRSAEVVALTPAPSNPESEARTDAGSPKPLVRSIHEELAEMLEKSDDEVAAPKPAQARPAEPAAPVKPARARVEAESPEVIDDKAMRRAAFTLRLDAKRHLKLRLASTVKNRSAQQLVTAALDKFLAEIPEIEALAAQVKRNRP
jgi:hypothetical protein